MPRRPEASGGRRGWSPGQRRLREADDNNRRSLEILTALTHDAPDNPRYRLAMARSQRDRYLLRVAGGRREEAEQAKRRGDSTS